MYDGPSGEIQYPDQLLAVTVAKPASLSPDPMRERIVDDCGPENEKDRHRAELHTLCEGAGDEGRRDDGEHQLIDHPELMGNRRGITVRIRGQRGNFLEWEEGPR